MLGRTAADHPLLVLLLLDGQRNNLVIFGDGERMRHCRPLSLAPAHRRDVGLLAVPLVHLVGHPLEPTLMRAAEVRRDPNPQHIGDQPARLARGDF